MKRLRNTNIKYLLIVRDEYYPNPNDLYVTGFQAGLNIAICAEITTLCASNGYYIEQWERYKDLLGA